MAAFSVATTSAGVPLGATTPPQATVSYPFSPASSRVGTSGISARRFRLLTPMARTLPLLTSGVASDVLTKR